MITWMGSLIRHVKSKNKDKNKLFKKDMHICILLISKQNFRGFCVERPAYQTTSTSQKIGNHPPRSKGRKDKVAHNRKFRTLTFPDFISFVCRRTK